jgi:hypothetical protein
MSDKWKSRKWVALGAILLLVVSMASVAMFAEKATFAEWSGMLQWLLPVMYGMAIGGNTADKFLWTKQKK